MTDRSAVTVSVLVPLYNSASTVERCLRSAMRQSLDDIEILVGDDGSTDDGPENVEALAREDRRIRLLRLGANGGKPRAMNRMVEQARGTWIAVLDADDAYHPRRLETLVAAAATVGTDLVADNLRYIDAGVGQALRTAFPETGGADRVLAKAELIRDADSFAEFDYGILKPMVRRDFVARHAVRYREQAKLAEDFYYLLDCFVAGGRLCLVSRALYDWTLPFGTVSRAWTTTGAGAWRYDYSHALTVNQQVIAEMRQRGDAAVVALLERRARQYRVMIPYLRAQRQAADGRRVAAFGTILLHPSTFGLLTRRIVGRAGRVLRRPRQALAIPATGEVMSS